MQRYGTETGSKEENTVKKQFCATLAVLLLLTLAACGANTKNDANAFQPFTAVDNAKCRINVTGIDPDNLFGYTVKLQLKNKSLTQTLFFTTEECTVNGVEWDPWLYTEVEPGRTESVEMSFSGEPYRKLIPEITDIELIFKVTDTDNDDAEAANARVHIYPIGRDNAKRHVHELQPPEKLAFDNDQFVCIVQYLDPEGFYGNTLRLYMENKTDRRVVFSAADATVNGIAVDLLWAHSVYAGHIALDGVVLDDNDLTQNGITEIESIEFVMNVYDYGSTTLLFSQRISYNP